MCILLNMNKTLEKLKAISGPSFEFEPERWVGEVFDFDEQDEIILCSDMLKAGLIWVGDGLVGFHDNVFEILWESWPEFRQYADQENAIEEDVNRGSTANPFASASKADGRRVSIADEFAAAGNPLGDDEG